MPARVIFVTGTDTGVGKTVLTGLLLHHLREKGLHALAMKPFCSGGLEDVRFLRALQDNELSEAEVNPWFFPEPVAPLVSARRHRRTIPLEDVVRAIQRTGRSCEYLLVEGAGGLLVPLGEKYTVADLVRRCADSVIVVAANRLGTINHTCLTVRVLQQFAGRRKLQAVLMQHKHEDASTTTNLAMLRQWLDPVPVENIAFLGRNPSPATVKNSAKKFQKALARLAGGN